MPCVEYHLLWILICLAKSGISLNLRIELGFRFIKLFASLPRTEQVFGSHIRNLVSSF